MRNIITVSNNLVNLIPDNSDKKFISLKHLIKKHIIESIPYSDRSVIESSWFWNKLAFFTNNAITIDDYNQIPWCKKYIDIFQDKIKI